jgi:hypothetical protein
MPASATHDIVLARVGGRKASLQGGEDRQDACSSSAGESGGMIRRRLWMPGAAEGPPTGKSGNKYPLNCQRQK